MNEQIFLGGVPVIGFGASEDDENKFYGALVGGPLIGLVAGSVTGYFISKAHPVIGTAVGGMAGTAIGLGAGYLYLYAVAKTRK